MATELSIQTDLDIVEFISKEAHDLKSPFNRILGFIKLVMKGMDGPISDEARQDLTIAFQNSQYSMVLMGGLVEMARLSRGEKALLMDECPLEPLLQQALSDWKNRFPQEKPLEATCSAPPITIKADENGFRQAILYWIAYVLLFVKEASLSIRAAEEGTYACLIVIRGAGQKARPPQCEREMFGYNAVKLLELHHGKLLRAIEDDQGVEVQLSLPCKKI